MTFSGSHYIRTFADLVKVHQDKLARHVPSEQREVFCAELEAALGEAREHGAQTSDAQFKHLHDHVQKILRKQEQLSADYEKLSATYAELLVENQQFRQENAELKALVERLGSHLERLELRLGISPSTPPKQENGG